MNYWDTPPYSVTPYLPNSLRYKLHYLLLNYMTFKREGRGGREKGKKEREKEKEEEWKERKKERERERGGGREREKEREGDREKGKRERLGSTKAS